MRDLLTTIRRHFDHGLAGDVAGAVTLVLLLTLGAAIAGVI